MQAWPQFKECEKDTVNQKKKPTLTKLFNTSMNHVALEPSQGEIISLTIKNESLEEGLASSKRL